MEKMRGDTWNCVTDHSSFRTFLERSSSVFKEFQSGPLPVLRQRTSTLVPIQKINITEAVKAQSLRIPNES